MDGYLEIPVVFSWPTPLSWAHPYTARTWVSKETMKDTGPKTEKRSPSVSSGCHCKNRLIRSLRRVTLMLKISGSQKAVCKKCILYTHRPKIYRPTTMTMSLSPSVTLLSKKAFSSWFKQEKFINWRQISKHEQRLRTTLQPLIFKCEVFVAVMAPTYDMLFHTYESLGKFLHCSCKVKAIHYTSLCIYHCYYYYVLFSLLV